MRTDGVGFEPTVQLVATQLISSQLPSATRAPVQACPQIAVELFASFPHASYVGFEPSFAEKAQPERVGFQNEESAPGEDGDEHPGLADDLAAKVSAMKARGVVE